MNKFTFICLIVSLFGANLGIDAAEKARLTSQHELIEPFDIYPVKVKNDLYTVSWLKNNSLYVQPLSNKNLEDCQIPINIDDEDSSKVEFMWADTLGNGMIDVLATLYAGESNPIANLIVLVDLRSCTHKLMTLPCEGVSCFKITIPYQDYFDLLLQNDHMNNTIDNFITRYNAEGQRMDVPFQFDERVLYPGAILNTGSMSYLNGSIGYLILAVNNEADDAVVSLLNSKLEMVKQTHKPSKYIASATGYYTISLGYVHENRMYLEFLDLNLETEKKVPLFKPYLGTFTIAFPHNLKDGSTIVKFHYVNENNVQEYDKIYVQRVFKNGTASDAFEIASFPAKRLISFFGFEMEREFCIVIKSKEDERSERVYIAEARCFDPLKLISKRH